jgi:hypothetical protein
VVPEVDEVVPDEEALPDEEDPPIEVPAPKPPVAPVPPQAAKTKVGRSQAMRVMRRL